MVDLQANALKSGPGWQPQPRRGFPTIFLIPIVLVGFLAPSALDVPLGLIAHHRLYQLYGRKVTVSTLHSYGQTSCGLYRQPGDGRPMKYLLRDGGPWAEGISPDWAMSHPGTKRWLDERWSWCISNNSKGSSGYFLDPVPLWFINKFAK
ncbi:MAG: hypothetical protein KKC14_09500 [Alphaproteobacteria bacterium]|nr:hypothetical protein [Alphaproteobacteria bacterium]